MSYYKITDKELNSKFNEMCIQRKASLDVAHGLAKEFGADLHTAESPGGVTVAFEFKELPDKNCWKRIVPNDKTCNLWTPKHSTKGGKELVAKIQEWRSTSVSHYHFGSLLGMDFFQAPGVRSKPVRKGSKNRVFFVEVPSNFKVKKKLKGKMKRITDIEWEKVK